MSGMCFVQGVRASLMGPKQWETTEGSLFRCRHWPSASACVRVRVRSRTWLQVIRCPDVSGAWGRRKLSSEAPLSRYKAPQERPLRVGLPGKQGSEDSRRGSFLSPLLWARPPRDT